MGERILGIFPRIPFRKPRRDFLRRTAEVGAGVAVVSLLPGCDREAENAFYNIMQGFANTQRDLFWNTYTKISGSQLPARIMSLQIATNNGATSRLEVTQDLVQDGETLKNGNTNSIRFVIEKIEQAGKKTVVVHQFAKDTNGYDWSFSAAKFIDGREIQELGYPAYISSNQKDLRIERNRENLLTERSFFSMAGNTIAGDMKLFLEATAFGGATAQAE